VAGDGRLPGTGADLAASLPGQVSHERTPQALYSTESLSQALRQLILYGRDGLPVLSPDGSTVEGWITNASAIHAIARNLGAAATDASRAELEAELSAAHQNADGTDSPNPLHGFHVIEVLLDEHSPALGRPLRSVRWPDGHIPVSILHRRVLHEADPAHTLTAGDRVNLLAKQHSGDQGRGERSDAPPASDNAGPA
jgi:CIC family chloride channel protein